jgi:nicotinate phosphoribosyltransferase
MTHVKNLYAGSLSLLTDLYQLTMAQAYQDACKHKEEAIFHLSFRKSPFNGGYAVACGIGTIRDLINKFYFSPGDLRYLSTLRGNDGKALFNKNFLHLLNHTKLECSIHAVPEGTIVFPHEPIVRVQGPLYQCQLLETMLLNTINFETLIATKASRICKAAYPDPVLEFGLRRAQGIDGGLTASKAAYIGGCAATSNVLAGKLFGIPVKGTHAHSWIMSFDNELEAFDQYARSMPNNCVFLVDTYDTIEGVKKAIQIGEMLRTYHHEMVGIRLDSGDLADLSIKARSLLDAYGFEKAVIVASNDLDEYLIESLKQQGAAINVWGVGTRLSTAYDQPALGGVYKLSALRKKGKAWKYKVKLSNNPEKVSLPGKLQVRRYVDGNGGYAKDLIVNEIKKTAHKDEYAYETLLKPLFMHGRDWDYGNMVHIDRAKERVQLQLEKFPVGMRRFQNPHEYTVALDCPLHDLRTELIKKLRAQENK